VLINATNNGGAITFISISVYFDSTNLSFPALSASLIASIPSYAKQVISKSALIFKAYGVNLL